MPKDTEYQANLEDDASTLADEINGIAQALAEEHDLKFEDVIGEFMEAISKKVLGA